MGFCHGTIRQPARIYQLHITVVGFRGFIQQGKNASRPCHSHYNAVHLLAYLGDRLGKVFIQGKKRNQGSQSQTHVTVQRQDCPQDSAKHIADIPQVGIYRHHDIRYPVCQIRAVFQFPVDFPELFQAPFLMTEHLDDLRAFHHFFNITVHASQIRLLFNKILSGQTA